MTLHTIGLVMLSIGFTLQIGMVLWFATDFDFKIDNWLNSKNWYHNYRYWRYCTLKKWWKQNVKRETV